MLDRPVVVILGATGCGKTKLSIQLCKRFNGEVISTDSMQVYEGLDVVTNKVTQEEACGVPHHMISFLDPLYTGFTVVQFRNKALKIIEDLHAKNKIPVIVGGTNYYNEAVLWKTLLSDPEGQETITDKTPSSYREMLPGLPEECYRMTNEELYEKLKVVDPVEATRVHPNRRRRVLRCLHYFYVKGRRISDDIRKQHDQDGANELGGPLRFPNSCVLWIQCEKNILHRRLDDRVDEMVEKNLRDELTSFYDKYYEPYTKLRKQLDVGVPKTNDDDDRFTKGIFQCIGLKEFEKFLKLLPDERSTPSGQKTFDQGVRFLKISTRQYARTQQRWIERRFLREERQASPVYALDATYLDAWDVEVSQKAMKLVESFLDDDKTTLAKEALPRIADNLVTDSCLNRHCLECDSIISGDKCWESHLKGKPHKFNVRRRKEEYEKLSTNLNIIQKRKSMEKNDRTLMTQGGDNDETTKEEENRKIAKCAN